MPFERRRIENYGVMKLTPEDRGSCNLLVTTEVIQRPYSEYLNVKSNPFKSHYGYAVLMYGEFAVSIHDLPFRRYVLLDKNQYIVQLAHQEFHNSKIIASQVGRTTFSTTVDYPIWNFDEIRFKLEPGVIIEVYKTSVGMIDVEPDGVSQPDYAPPVPSGPPIIPLPPPEGTPESQKIPLSPPYEGEDDNGNTYVRPEETPPPPTGGDIGKLYKVRIKYTGALGDLTELDGPFWGPIRGCFVDQTSSGVRGVLQASNQDGSLYETARKTNSVVGQPASMTILEIILQS